MAGLVTARTVLFIENGEIVERGSHLQLLTMAGKYAQLWLRQQRHGDEEEEDETAEGLPETPSAQEGEPLAELEAGLARRLNEQTE